MQEPKHTKKELLGMQSSMGSGLSLRAGTTTTELDDEVIPRFEKKNAAYLVRRFAPRLLQAKCSSEEKLKEMKIMSRNFKAESENFKSRVLELSDEKDTSHLAFQYVKFLDSFVEAAVNGIGTCWEGKALMAGTVYLFLSNTLSSALNTVLELGFDKQGVPIKALPYGIVHGFMNKTVDGAKAFASVSVEFGVDGWKAHNYAAQMNAVVEMLTSWKSAIEVIEPAIRNMGGDTADWMTAHSSFTALLEELTSYDEST